MPARPRMMPPVGKSGPGTILISSSMPSAGSSIKAIQASITSPRLCGGILVAIPTAMPPAPLTSRLGNFAGKNTGPLSRHAQHCAILPAPVIVRLQIDGLVPEIVERGHGGPREPHLGIALGRGRIAVHRA